jgi:hypothetical protein
MGVMAMKKEKKEYVLHYKKIDSNVNAIDPTEGSVRVNVMAHVVFIDQGDFEQEGWVIVYVADGYNEWKRGQMK